MSKKPHVEAQNRGIMRTINIFLSIWFLIVIENDIYRSNWKFLLWFWVVQFLNRARWAAVQHRRVAVRTSHHRCHHREHCWVDKEVNLRVKQARIPKTRWRIFARHLPVYLATCKTRVRARGLSREYQRRRIFEKKNQRELPCRTYRRKMTNNRRLLAIPRRGFSR